MQSTGPQPQVKLFASVLNQCEHNPLCFQIPANNFTARAVKLFVRVEKLLHEQHGQIMTCAKDRLNPSAGSDDPWRTS